ncbi:MAG: c-type cytochrome [Acidobacteriota bacterium]
MSTDPWLGRAAGALAFGLLSLLLAGCARGCPSRRPPIHPNPNMDRQPKYLAQAESRFFYDGAAMRLPVPGTVARGELRDDEEYFTGRSPWGFFVGRNPLEATDGLIARGRSRYGIYCSPCHGPRGDGRGMLATRAKVKSADLLARRVREMPDGRIYHVISNGLGLMPGYRYPIRPADRWAIVAYLRRLQEGEAGR